MFSVISIQIQKSRVEGFYLCHAIWINLEKKLYHPTHMY